MKIKTNEEWVGFGKKEWRFITNNFELVKNAGLQGNVSVELAKDGSQYVYFTYILQKVK